MPITVTIGTAAFFSACTKSTLRCATPLAASCVITVKSLTPTTSTVSAQSASKAASRSSPLLARASVKTV